MYKEWSSVLAARVFVILFGLDVLVFMWQTRDRHLVVDTRVGDAYRTEGADMRFGTRRQNSVWNRIEHLRVPEHRNRYGTAVRVRI